MLSDVPGRFAPGSRLLAARDGIPAPALVVAASRPHKSGAQVRFAGVDDRDAAEALRGVTLEVERSEVPAAAPGTYYYYELLGCRCRESGRDLGEVVDLVEDGGGLLLIVEMPAALEDARRRMPVPFVQSFIRGIDVAEGTIDLALPPGLLETCAST